MLVPGKIRRWDRARVKRDRADGTVRLILYGKGTVRCRRTHRIRLDNLFLVFIHRAALRYASRHVSPPIPRLVGIRTTRLHVILEPIFGSLSSEALEYPLGIAGVVRGRVVHETRDVGQVAEVEIGS